MASLYPDFIPPHAAHPTREDFAVVQHPLVGTVIACRRPFRKGEVLARFDGVTLGYVTQHSLRKSEGVHLLDRFFLGLLSHACDPNVSVDMERQLVTALKPMEAGTVLMMDYSSTEDFLFTAFDCACQAPGCRGRIVGRQETVAPAAG